MIPRRVTFTALLAALALSGCSSLGGQDVPPPDMEGTLEESVQQSRQAEQQAQQRRQRDAKKRQQEVPAEVQQALIEDAGDGGRVQEQRFDLSVNDVPARAFFMGLVEDTPYNMVVHPSVSGTITLTLKDVSVPEVMDTVREVYGYEYKRNQTGFLVLPNKTQTRIFRVNYLNVSREGKSQTRVSSGQVSERVSQTGGSDNQGGNQRQGTARTVASSEIETRTDANFWQELRSSVEAIAAADPDARVVISPQSGLVVVRANPSTLREIGRYLEKAELSMQRQVILEAKILEVELSEGFQSGINWGAIRTNNDGDSIVIGQTGGGTVLDGGQSDIAGNAGNLNPDNLSQINNTAASAFGGVFSMAFNVESFAGFVEFLETQGDVSVLSSPRVSTVNNQKAVIKVGSDEFFVTDFSSTEEDQVGGSEDTTTDIELTPFFSGIALDVTPQIGDNGEVTLHIHPSVSEVEDQTKRIAFGQGQSIQLPLAFSTIRESDSIVRADSGQVVVIGGLMKNRDDANVAGVPLLSDLPFVGTLFEQRGSSTIKSELVILLRPIVVEDDTWTNTLEDTRQRFRDLSDEQRSGDW